jgi:hypothetical protein
MLSVAVPGGGGGRRGLAVSTKKKMADIEME